MQPKMTAAELQAFLRSDFPQVADAYEVTEVGPMTARVRMTPRERHLRPGGTVSGPTIFELADCGVYICLLGMIGPVPLAVTTSASIDFMRKPVAGQPLEAVVELLKLGRILAVGDVRIHSAGVEGPVARASLTYSIPPMR